MTVYRILLGVIIWVVGRWDVRYQWLAHYLVGDGSPMTPPYEVVTRGLLVGPSFPSGEPYRTHGELFFLVGTMTLYRTIDHRGEMVIGVDRYDWHPNRFYCKNCGAWGYSIERGRCRECWSTDIEGEWWWSPTPLPGWIYKVLPPALKKYCGVGDTGNLSVSNELWAVLGGRSFDTHVEARVDDLPLSLY